MNKLKRQLQEAEQKVRILYEITRLVSSFLHPQHVLDGIVDLLFEEFKLDSCSIKLLDQDGKLRIKSQKGLSKNFIDKASHEPTIDTYSGECFLTGKIIIINDTDTIDRSIYQDHLITKEIKSFAITPIKVEGETIGVLVTSSKRKNYFHERFNDVIYTVGSQIGLAIRISQLYDKIYNFNKELEAKIEERTKELKEKTERLIEAERLAAFCLISQRIAHECRNSLTIVGGFAKRLEKLLERDSSYREYVKIIIDGIGELERKINEIIESSQSPYSIADFGKFRKDKAVISSE